MLTIYDFKKKKRKRKKSTMTIFWIYFEFSISAWLDIMHFTTWQKSLLRVTDSKICLNTYLINIILDTSHFHSYAILKHTVKFSKTKTFTKFCKLWQILCAYLFEKAKMNVGKCKVFAVMLGMYYWFYFKIVFNVLVILFSQYGKNRAREEQTW